MPGWRGHSWRRCHEPEVAAALQGCCPPARRTAPASPTAAVNGKGNGAATYAFIHAINRHKDLWGFEILYGELLQAMHDELRDSPVAGHRGQRPTLSATMSFHLTDRRHKFSL